MLPYEKSNLGSAPPAMKVALGETASTTTGTTQNFPKLFSVWNNARTKLRNLVGIHTEKLKEAEERRRKRYIDIDTEEERAKKNLESDEYFIPLRVIDTNVRREQAKYIAYLLQAPRDVIVKTLEKPEFDCSIVEEDFTERVRYDDWEVPILEWIDGSQTHGVDFIEVLFDINFPGHFFCQSIGYENLLFPLDAKGTIQNCSFIVRIMEFTREDLADLVLTKGFSSDKIDQILGKSSSTSDAQSEENSLIKIEKVFFKEEGIVKIAWSCVETVDGWLKAPEPFFNGRVEMSQPSIDPVTGQMVQGQIAQITETMYPCFMLPYIVSENKRIYKIKGRVFLDELVQEAASALSSSAITAYKRASGLYFSSENPSGNSLDEAQTEVKLRQGAIFDAQIKSFNLPYPDSSIFNAVNTIIGNNQQETSQINFAAMNRQDSRKTATEVSASQQEGTLLSGVQVALFSIAYRKFRTACFLIYYSRAKAGLIKVKPEILNIFVSGLTLKLRPAGDVDVIERQKKLQAMMQAWPVYQNTPAANVFLVKLTELLFPDEAPDYVAALQSGDVKSKLLTACSEILTGLVDTYSTDKDPSNDQQIAQLTQLIQAIQQVMQPETQSQQAGPGLASQQPMQ